MKISVVQVQEERLMAVEKKGVRCFTRSDEHVSKFVEPALARYK